MARWTVSKPFDWSRAETSTSCFCVCPVREASFSSEPLVLFVLNISDQEILDKAKSSPDNYRSWLEQATNSGERQGVGKREGMGNPGGGVNTSMQDSVSGAAKRELEDETGGVAIGPRSSSVGTVRELFAIQQFLILDKKTGERIGYPIPYELGKEPSVSLDPRTQVGLRNPIHMFHAEIQWEGSKLQSLFRKIADRDLANGLNTEDGIREYGVPIFFENEDPEDVASLGITEIGEIKGLAVVPISALITMTENRHFYIEDIYFYKTHVIRTLRGLEMMGLIPGSVEGAA